MGDGLGGVEKPRFGGEIGFDGGTASEHVGFHLGGVADVPLGKGHYMTFSVGLLVEFLDKVLRGESTREINTDEIARLKANGSIDPKANTKNNTGGTWKKGSVTIDRPAGGLYAGVEGKGHIPNSIVSVGGLWRGTLSFPQKTTNPSDGNVHFKSAPLTNNNCTDLPGENFCANLPSPPPPPSVGIHEDGRSETVPVFNSQLGVVVDLDVHPNLTVTIVPAAWQVHVDDSGNVTHGYWAGVALRPHSDGAEVPPATAKVDPQGRQHHVDVGGTAKYAFGTNRAGRLKYVIKNIEGTAVAEGSKDVREGSNDVDILAKDETNSLSPGQYFVNFTFEPEKGKVEWHADGNIKSLVVKAPTPPIKPAALRRDLENKQIVVGQSLTARLQGNRAATITWVVQKRDGSATNPEVKGSIPLTTTESPYTLDTSTLAPGDYQLVMKEGETPLGGPIPFTVVEAMTLEVTNKTKISRPQGFGAGSPIRVIVKPSRDTNVSITVNKLDGTQITGRGSDTSGLATGKMETTFNIKLPTKADVLVRGKNNLMIHVKAGDNEPMKIPITVKVGGKPPPPPPKRPKTERGK